MSHTPGTRVITLRLNKKKDADIFYHISQSENYTQMFRDALRYYVMHEKEAIAELYPNPRDREKAYS